MYEDAVNTGPSNEYQARYVTKELGHYPKTMEKLSGGVRHRRHLEIAGDKAAAAMKAPPATSARQQNTSSLARVRTHTDMLATLTWLLEE